jgi:hypothetical protein
MKKIFVIILSTFSSANVIFAQTIENSNVPKPILSAIQKAYPYPENIKWEMDYDNYVAKFQKDKVEMMATYDKEGAWIKTETPVTHKSLPAAVKSCLTKQFDIYKENDIERIDKPESVCYQIDLEYNQKNYEVIISDKGDLISKEEVKEYKKD